MKENNAKDICHIYNSILPSKITERKKIIKKLIKEIGNNYLIESPFYCDYGYNIKIGDNFNAKYGLIILDEAKINFGDNIFIGPNCEFYAEKEINIGNNVYFRGKNVVLPGVTIGNNTIIEVGSIVTKNIPDNCIVSGNPAKIIKKIENNKINNYFEISKI